MVDEKKIDSYREFYNTITDFLKIPAYKIDWRILEKHQGLVESLDVKTNNDVQVETAQEEFDNYVKTLTDFPIVRLTVVKSAEFNIKINVKAEMPETKRKSPPQDVSGFLLNVINSMTEYSAQVEKDKKINKQKLKNTYETLLTVKKCLADCGLLMEEIKKRPEPTFYNLILIDKTETKKQTYSHYYITKEQLDDYVNARNEGKSMYIKGRFWQYSPKTDITITATKFKNEEEIKLYKKLIGLRDGNDKAFSNSGMCLDITAQLISPKFFHTPLEPIKSIQKLIEEGKIKEALKLTINDAETSEDKKHKLILLSARFNTLEDNKRKDIISTDKYNLEFNKIVDSLIAETKE